MTFLSKKKGMIVAAALVVVCMSVPALISSVDVSADVATGSIGSNLMWIADSESGTITISGNGPMVDGIIRLPANVLITYPYLIVEEGVTSIGALAFTSTMGKGIRFVTFPSTLERIERDAFKDCNVQELNVPPNVTYIHPGAFYNCPITAVTVDENNNVYTSRSGVMFTKNMMEIVHYPAKKVGRQYTIPEGVRTIGEYAFVGNMLYEVTIPNTVDYISDWAFNNCNDMLNLTIPDSVIHLGYGSIGYCRNLSKLVIGDGITNITMDMVPSIFESVKTLHLGKGVVSIDKEFRRGLALMSITVDQENPNLSSVSGVLYNKGATEIVLIPPKLTGKFVMPNSVRYVGSYVFQYSGITSVVLSENLQAIGSQAFYKNDTISSMKIPKSVKTIGDRAFADCTKMVTVYFESTVPPSMGNDAFAVKNVRNTELRVYSSIPNGFLDNYVGTNSVAYYDSDAKVSEIDEIAANPLYIVALAVASMIGLVLAEIFISRKQKQQ